MRKRKIRNLTLPWTEGPVADKCIKPVDETGLLVFYLAMEEWAVEHTTDTFFVWNVDPTVIFGHNQDMEAEVNVEYCREHGIRMFRRKSGGGCVYSDKGNLMTSYITPRTDVKTVFNDYLGGLCRALESLGFPAVASEHNDVLIGDRKVSGNAFYALPHASIVHGTMLHSVDFTAMQKSITPSVSKLAKHSVKSVRQRVVNLAEIAPELTMGKLIDGLTATFKTDERILTQKEIEEIKEIEKQVIDLFNKASKSDKPRFFYNGGFFNTKYMQEHDALSNEEYVSMLKEYKGKVLAITGMADIQADYRKLDSISSVDGITTYTPEKVNHVMREIDGEPNILNTKKEYKNVLKKDIYGVILYLDKLSVKLLNPPSVIELFKNSVIKLMTFSSKSCKIFSIRYSPFR